jgi:hypothetical protein
MRLSQRAIWPVIHLATRGHRRTLFQSCAPPSPGGRRAASAQRRSDAAQGCAAGDEAQRRKPENVDRLCRDRFPESRAGARSFGKVWRPGSESNRRTRLCRPLHDHSATRPVTARFLRQGRVVTPSAGAWRARLSHFHRLKTRNPGGPGLRLIWSGKRDSNSRPRPWQGRALPTELFPQETAHFTEARADVNTAFQLCFIAGHAARR